MALVAESIAQIPISGNFQVKQFLQRKFCKQQQNFLFIVSQSKLLSLLEATNMIIRYIIKRFENPNAPIILLKALKSLCDANASLENVQAYASLNYMKHPESSKSNGDKDSSPKSEVKRSRSELSIVILQQLTQPLTQGTVPLTNFSETQFDLTVSEKAFNPLLTNIQFYLNSFNFRNFSKKRSWIF